jgi:hypothetical protein
MAALRQRHVVELELRETRMVEALAARLGVSKTEAFRRAVEALYRELIGPADPEAAEAPASDGR